MRDHYDFSKGVRGKYVGIVDTNDIHRVGLDEKTERAPTGMKGRNDGADTRVFVEHRPQGGFAVRRQGSERASAIEQTQAEAITRARKLTHGAILIERVRNTSVGRLEKWRTP